MPKSVALERRLSACLRPLSPKALPLLSVVQYGFCGFWLSAVGTSEDLSAAMCERRRSWPARSKSLRIDVAFFDIRRMLFRPLLARIRRRLSSSSTALIEVLLEPSLGFVLAAQLFFVRGSMGVQLYLPLLNTDSGIARASSSASLLSRDLYLRAQYDVAADDEEVVAPADVKNCCPVSCCRDELGVADGESSSCPNQLVLVAPTRADAARTWGCNTCGVGVDGTEDDDNVAGGGTDDARVASVRPRRELELGMALWWRDPSLMSPAVALFSPRRDTRGSCIVRWFACM